ncbi:MAG: hypothetical protein Q9214_002303, partial [Letrouitia sp. 1 TL-2023]
YQKVQAHNDCMKTISDASYAHGNSSGVLRQIPHIMFKWWEKDYASRIISRLT